MKTKKLIKRKKNLKEELLRIKRALIKLGAKKIILFGSLAHDVVGRTTDIDLLVIKDTKASFSERLDEVYSKVVPRMATDIMVYTQDEIDDLSKWNIFIRRVLKEGKIIYAA